MWSVSRPGRCDMFRRVVRCYNKMLFIAGMLIPDFTSGNSFDVTKLIKMVFVCLSDLDLVCHACSKNVFLFMSVEILLLSSIFIIRLQ